jgi:hypothetical protein
MPDAPYDLDLFRNSRRYISVAKEHGGPSSLDTVCPPHDGLKRDAATGSPPIDLAIEQVDWAGLPVNLDMVFSQQQRDKVYAQHLMRKRGTRLWRWLQNSAQPCVCDVAADGGCGWPDVAESTSGR